MAAKIKFGLIVGAVGLIINIFVSFLVGICGPFIGFAAGAIAGWLTVRADRPTVRNTGVSLGTQAGAIAGALVLVGQLIGNIGGLLFIQSTQTEPLFGELPQTPEAQAGFWAAGIGVVICFGLLGLGLGAMGGAGAGYLATPESGAGPEMPPPPYPPVS